MPSSACTTINNQRYMVYGMAYVWCTRLWPLKRDKIKTDFNCCMQSNVECIDLTNFATRHVSSYVGPIAFCEDTIFFFIFLFVFCKILSMSVHLSRFYRSLHVKLIIAFRLPLHFFRTLFLK